MSKDDEKVYDFTAELERLWIWKNDPNDEKIVRYDHSQGRKSQKELEEARNAIREKLSGTKKERNFSNTPWYEMIVPSLPDIDEDDESSPCTHDWRITQGFSSVYKDCTKCGLKG